MKILSVALPILISTFAMAEECVFDEKVFHDFARLYVDGHEGASLEGPGKFTASLNDLMVFVEGGGCAHLGATVQVQGQRGISESQLLDLVLMLYTEFGQWLAGAESLSESIHESRWSRYEGVYYFQVDSLTSLEAWLSENGDLMVSFYVN
ncbi:hypothetical protein [Gynuella sp.]|uniref:hypothetical protein n=1 Tax=Gynuella sp. TaxID=2969146 RepID=UPI003D0E4BB5